MARPAIPKKGSEPGILKAFLDEVTKYDVSHRLWRWRGWEKVRCYLANEQWLQEDDVRGGTSATSPFWRPLQVTTNNWRPMPVQNEMAAPVQNETARLVGAGSEPYIRPSDDNPRNVRAAQKSKDVLQSVLEELHWPEKEHEWCYHGASYGTGILAAGVMLDYSEPKVIPIDGAMRCGAPGCDFKTASLDVPDNVPDDAKMSVEDVLEKPGRATFETKAAPNNKFLEQQKVTLQACPTCEEPQPLVPYTPSLDEARSGKDAFGRSMGEKLPVPKPKLRVIPPQEAFPENNGLGLGPSKPAREWGWRHIESLEDLRRSYANGWQVKAESQTELMKWRPVLGIDTLGGVDSNTYSNHAEVVEFHCEPWPEAPGQPPNRGRSIVMSNGIVLLDDDYMIARKGKPNDFIRRWRFEPFQLELRDGELWGIGAEMILSQQDSINTRKSQVQSARHRFGSPKLLVEEGGDLLYSGFADTGYDGDVWYYRLGPRGDKPEPFGNTQMSGQWAQEETSDIESINRTFGTMEIETGDPPAGVEAAQAMMYIGQKATERRKPRLIRLRTAKARIFKQLLEIVQEYATDEQLYRVRGRNDRWTLKSFRGAELEGQTDVIIEEAAMKDDTLFQSVAINQALDRGILVADTEDAKRKIGRALGVPPNINEQANGQVTRAEEEWMGWADDGELLAVKEHDDVHTLHYQTHLLDWEGEEARLLKQEANWNEISLALWGWEDDFMALIAEEQRIKMQPPAPEPPMAVPTPDPNNPGMMIQPTPESQQAAVQKWESDVQLVQMLATLPKPLELRLEFIWKNKLMQAIPGLFEQPMMAPDVGGQPQPVLDYAGDPIQQPAKDPARADATAKLLRFDAHLEAHRLMVRVQAMKTQAGVPQPANPDGPSTPAGMIPGNDAAPGAGGGAGATPAPGAGPGTGTASGAGAAA